MERVSHELHQLDVTADTLREMVVLLEQQLDEARVREGRLLGLLEQVCGAASRSPERPRRAAAADGVPLLEQIHAYLASCERPRRSWQIAQALQINRSVTAELSKLVKRQAVVRVGPGLYTAAREDERPAGPRTEDEATVSCADAAGMVSPSVARETL